MAPNMGKAWAKLGSQCMARELGPSLAQHARLNKQLGNANAFQQWVQLGQSSAASVWQTSLAQARPNVGKLKNTLAQHWAKPGSRFITQWLPTPGQACFELGSQCVGNELGPSLARHSLPSIGKLAWSEQGPVDKTSSHRARSQPRPKLARQLGPSLAQVGNAIWGSLRGAISSPHHTCITHSLQQRRLESRLCMLYKTIKTSQPTPIRILHPYEPAMTNNTESHIPPTPLMHIHIHFSQEPSEYGIYCQLPLYMQAPSKDLRMDYRRNSYLEICRLLFTHTHR